MRWFILLIVTCMFPLRADAAIEPVPFRTPDRAPDAARLLPASAIHLDGYLGQRVTANEEARLLNVDEDRILAGFRKRPGEQAWIGEHVGKFLHAATLAWAYTGDQRLREKIDRVAAELIKCQDPDGYLGTYLEKDKWTSWDVWVHKYNLIGLLTYYQYTGNEPALAACRRMGDLLVATFPAKKSIIRAGEHVGMAATSVLEPIVLLYRFTGDQKYLDFAKYIVSAYNEPGGPRIVETLTNIKRVDKTANGKAYEMMSNLVGLCELYRATGDRRYLVPCQNAFDDIVANHLYITGTVSQGEHFHDPHNLPNGPANNVGETCATVTWLQLCAQLLRLTGDVRCANELERTIYNHLMAAQRPDGAQWCYFTPLYGGKPYGPGINCCVSSGPRGMALVPQLSCFTYQEDGKDGLAINFFEPGTVSVQLNGQAVKAETRLDLQLENNTGELTISFEVDRPAEFGVKVRAPGWARNVRLKDGEKEIAPAGGWVKTNRSFKSGDSITVSFEMPGRRIEGQHSNKGFSALAWGPLVLAYDESFNANLPGSATLALLEGSEQFPMSIHAVFSDGLAFEARVRTAKDAAPRPATFVPFADAGASGGKYRVWLRNPDNLASISLLSEGRESRSRNGNLNGSIVDGSPESHVVTFDGRMAEQDWYAVTLDRPVSLSRVTFAHGHSFHDGGWFDASAGKPKVEVQRQKGGAWEPVGVLEDYPATTATDSKGLKDGQEFTLMLPSPVKAVAVRVVGRPACGDNPRQAFSSCGELAGYEK